MNEECSAQCLNGGTCVVVDGVVCCKCVGNYSGERCESPGVRRSEAFACKENPCFSLMIAFIVCSVICILLLVTIMVLLRGRMCPLKRYKVCKNSFKMRGFQKSGDTIPGCCDSQNCFSYSKMGTVHFPKGALTNDNSNGKYLRNMTEDKVGLICQEENSCGMYHNSDIIM